MILLIELDHQWSKKTIRIMDKLASLVYRLATSVVMKEKKLVLVAMNIMTGSWPVTVKYENSEWYSSSMLSALSSISETPYNPPQGLMQGGGKGALEFLSLKLGSLYIAKQFLF